MSRIGKLPIEIPQGVTVEVKEGITFVKGPKGELKKELHPNISIEIKDNVITVVRPNELKENRALHGLVRSLLANMIEGVTKGFEKELEIVGVGYRAKASGGKISLSLGFSHPIEYKAPDGVIFEMSDDKKNFITIKGIDKEMVGQAAATVRAFKPPEPYKGKGIRYVDEHVARKAGKAAGAGAA